MTQRMQSSMVGPQTDKRLLVLSPDDNVAVVLRALSGGEAILVSGVVVEVPIHVAVGHKIAIAAIADGESIVKYGAPIGSAIADIRIGDHVHLHNICSNYTPSHSLDAARGEHADDA